MTTTSITPAAAPDSPIGQALGKVQAGFWTALKVCATVMIAALYLRRLCLRFNDPDVWGRMAVGRLFLDSGSLPSTDPFSYTPTIPWIDHEWLAGVYFYLVHCWFGEAGLIVQKALFGVATLAIVLWVVRLRGGAYLPAILVAAIAFPVIAYGYLPRAQVFSYFFFALWLACLENYRVSDRPRRWAGLAVIPVTVPVWANCHGGFLAGFGLVAVYAVAALGRPRTLVPIVAAGALSLALTLVNPYGLDYWPYLVRAVSMERSGIGEWGPMPMTWQTGPFWALAGWGVVSGIYHWSRTRQLGVAPALLLAVTFVVSLRHMRHMPFFAIAACSFLPVIAFKPGWTPLETPERQQPADRFARRLACAVMLAMALFHVYGLVALDGPFIFDNSGGPSSMVIPFPADVVKEARDAGVEGNIAVPFDWGEYVIWHFYGRGKVSVDGRYEECYPEKTLEMVSRFFDAAEPGWRGLLEDYPTQHVLAPASAPVNNFLQADPQWELRFRGPHACFYSRRSAP